MEKTSRRKLLKAGAAGAVGAGLGLAATAGVANAAPAGGRRIHIHGTLPRIDPPPPPEGVFISISLAVDGPRDDLSGAGWDTGTNPATVAGACYYNQAGSVHGHSVELSGNVLLANNPANLAAEIRTVADLSTGEITWSLTRQPGQPPGGGVFQGTGTVVHG